MESNAADWMSKLIEVDPTKLVKDLVLIGSHDAATASISKWIPFSSIARTQNETVLELLVRRGVRYLDIRIGGGAAAAAGGISSVYIFHGCMRGGLFLQVVEQIATFVNLHSREFIILEVVPEYGRKLSRQHRHCVLETIRARLGDNKIYKNTPQVQFEGLTLEELIVKQRKQVLVLIHPRFYTADCDEEYVENHYGFVNSNTWLSNEWHNTHCTSVLLERNLTNCRNLNSKPLHNSQFVMTPPQVSTLSNVADVLTGKTVLSVQRLAQRLYKELPGCLHRHAHYPWNIVSMDFVDLAPPSLLDFLISLNFSATLQIERAALQYATWEEDVTDRVAALVLERKVLYITDIQKHLSIVDRPIQCTLAIAYKLSSSLTADTFVHNVDVIGKHQGLVLSEYTRFACRDRK